jgi:dCMP deaminase
MAKRTSATTTAVEVPKSDPARYLDRVKQVQWDHYYMEVALTVKTRANCFGALVGAVLVLENRIVSTGFNGTPADFANCRDGGCARCRERELHSQGKLDQLTDPDLAHGPKQLDLCVCVHAEANSLLSAARAGNRTDGSELYTTSKPCFACLKESYQAGVKRIVWLEEWEPTESKLLKGQYAALVEHLRNGNPRNFERLERQADAVKDLEIKPREPVLDGLIDKAEESYKKAQAEKTRCARAAARAAPRAPRARKAAAPKA